MVESGAPQGSSSGPIIWLIYTIELPELMAQEMGAPEQGELGHDEAGVHPTDERQEDGGEEQRGLETKLTIEDWYEGNQTQTSVG